MAGKVLKKLFSKFALAGAISLGLVSSAPQKQDRADVSNRSASLQSTQQPKNFKPTLHPKLYASPHMRALLGPLLDDITVRAGHKNVVIISDEGLKEKVEQTRKDLLAQIDRDLLLQESFSRVLTKEQALDLGLRDFSKDERTAFMLQLLELTYKGTGAAALTTPSRNGQATCIIILPSTGDYYSAITNNDIEKKKLMALVDSSVLGAYAMGHEVRHCKQNKEQDPTFREVDADRHGLEFAALHGATEDQLNSLKLLRFKHAFDLIVAKVGKVGEVAIGVQGRFDDPHAPDVGFNDPQNSTIFMRDFVGSFVYSQAADELRHFYRQNNGKIYESGNGEIFTRIRDTDNFFEKKVKDWGLSDWFNGYSFYTPKLERPEQELIKAKPALLGAMLEAMLRAGRFQQDPYQQRFAEGIVKSLHLYTPEQMLQPDVRALARANVRSNSLIMAQQQP